MSSELLYICPVNKIITMRRNWIGSSMIVALFALLAGGCGHSQRTLEFRGICVDDPQGENGLYNPGRGFRLETAVDVLYEKDTPTKELNELSAKYIADSVSLSQSYFYLTYLIGKELSEENFRHILMNCKSKEKRPYCALPTNGTLWDGRLSVLPANRYWRTWIN